jgi:hypothetical protein
MKQHFGVLTLLLGAVVSGQSLVAQGSNRASQRLTKEVRHELVMLPYYGVFDNLVDTTRAVPRRITTPPSVSGSNRLSNAACVSTLKSSMPAPEPCCGGQV